MPITDYNKKKQLDVDSVSGTPSVDKAQPVLIEGENGSFNLSNASFNQSKDASSEDTTISGMAWNDDGTKMYVVGRENDNVYEYNLSTAYDVSTASFNQSKDVSNADTIPQGISWNNDGTKMYIVGQDTESIIEFNVSTAYDISTASVDVQFFVSNEDTRPKGMAWNNDGTKMYVTGLDNSNIYEYNLSTAFDVTSASFNQSKDISSEDEGPSGLSWNDDGTKIYLVGALDVNIYEYDLSTAYDISTAIFNQSFDVSGQDTSPKGMAWNNDGTKMYVVGGSNDSVYEYNVQISDSKTGTGDIVLDWTNISSESDIAVYDQNENLLDYEIESFDATAETAVLWVYNSWVRDGTTQAQIAYGNNSANTDRQNVSGTWDSEPDTLQARYNLAQTPDSDTGTNEVLDSTSNNNDMSSTGTSSVSGQFADALTFDGTDDELGDGSNMSAYEDNSYSGWFKTTSSTDAITLVSQWDSGDTEGILITLNNGILNDFTSSDVDGELVVWGRGGTTGNAVHFRTDGFNLHDGNWHFFTVVKDESDGTGQGDYTVFIDGNQASLVTGRDQGDGGLSSTGDQPFKVSNAVTNGNGTEHFSGEIDELKVWQGVKKSEYHQAEWDASPRGGQVFFSQQAAETTTVGQTFNKNYTETVILSDSFSKSLLFTKSESFTLNDSLTKTVSLVKDESFTLNDSDIKEVQKVVQETLTTSDTYSRTSTFNRHYSETFTVSDTLSEVFGKKLNEGFSLNDEKSFVINSINSESLNLADSTSFALSKAFSEKLTVSDNLSKVINTAKSESLTLNDNYSSTSTYNRDYAETVSLSDVLTKFVGLQKDETITLNDEVKAEILTPLTLSENLSFSDQVSKSISLVREETLSIKDALLINATLERSYSESFALNDSDIKTVGKKLTETINTSDNYSRDMDYFRNYSGDLSLADSLSKTFRTKESETLSITDQKSKALFRTIEDSFSLADNTSFKRDAFRSYSETVSLSDSFSKILIFKKTLEDTVALSDNQGFGFFLDFSETLKLSDNYSEITIFARTLEETLTFSDEYDFFFSEGPGTPPYYAVVKIIEKGLPNVNIDTKGSGNIQFPNSEGNNADRKT